MTVTSNSDKLLTISMSNYENRYLDNVEGAFFVDKNCIACDTCVGIAPESFKLVNNFSYAIVYQQPNTEEQFDKCREALKACPVEAIGSVE